MANITDLLVQKLPQIKTRIIHLETVVKSAAVTVTSGAALTAHQYLTSAEHIEDLFTPAGILRIKHNLVYGGLLSVFGLFVPSPVKPSAAAPTQDAK